MVRVLVVEDDARLNQIVCASLRAAGYEAIGCANAAQATDALHGDLLCVREGEKTLGTLLDEKPVVRNDAIMMYSPYLEEGGTSK